jgi:putative glutathione S-transferase
MGKLEKGKWIAENEYAKTLRDNAKAAIEGGVRHWVSGHAPAPFAPEAGRYHLFVSHACPIAHATIIMRKLKSLERIISSSSVSPLMSEEGWTFKPDFPGTEADNLEGATTLRQFYLLSDPHYSGRVTVPMLWDKKLRTVVNNNATDITRIFNSEFDSLTGNNANFYPKILQAKIDVLLAFVLQKIVLGVYKTALTCDRGLFERNCRQLFEDLAVLDDRLQEDSFLFGSILSEADWFLYATLIRFDALHYLLVNAINRQISDLPNLLQYAKRLYDFPGIKDTTKFEHINAYYRNALRARPRPFVKGALPYGPESFFTSEQDYQ